MGFFPAFSLPNGYQPFLSFFYCLSSLSFHFSPQTIQFHFSLYKTYCLSNPKFLYSLSFSLIEKTHGTKTFLHPFGDNINLTYWRVPNISGSLLHSFTGLDNISLSHCTGQISKFSQLSHFLSFPSILCFDMFLSLKMLKFFCEEGLDENSSLKIGKKHA